MIGRDTENKPEKSNVPHVSIKPNATHKAEIGSDLSLASRPQVKALLGEIVINYPPRHLLFVKYCIFRYLSYIVSQMYSF